MNTVTQSLANHYYAVKNFKSVNANVRNAQQASNFSFLSISGCNQRQGTFFASIAEERAAQVCLKFFFFFFLVSRSSASASSASRGRWVILVTESILTASSLGGRAADKTKTLNKEDKRTSPCRDQEVGGGVELKQPEVSN